MDLNQRNPRIDPSRFSMVPRSDIPRATFQTQHAHKTTFDASYIIPMLAKEILPGDVIKGQATFFNRLGTLLFPLMDRLIFESFFFFVPNRILWTNWVKMMGERTNPSDSIAYTTPQVVSAANGFPATTAGGAGSSSIFDYFGLPTVGQVAAGATISVNALPLRAYNLIYNEWFRDENLQNSVTQNTGDGPDALASYTLLRRNKRPDYFTSALPAPLKGGVDVTLPLSGLAPITGIGVTSTGAPTAGNPSNTIQTQGTVTGWTSYFSAASFRGSSTSAGAAPQIYADLSAATGATINALRLAFQTQRLLERDARSGTRYTELLRSHFGVTPEDARLQRPEYIGGGRTDFQTQAIPQTSATGLTGGTSALGSLGAASTASDQHTFSYHATEHGWLLGLVNVRADLSYQQGLHKKWTRATRYDYYWPVFAHLGEQAIQNREIYARGDANDTLTFGYQERWAEYRYEASQITGLFRSTSTGNIDEWHLSEQFSSLPALNSAFIQDSTRETLSRVLAAGTNAYGMQILSDSLFRITATRAMPMYSVPGMTDRF